MEKLSEWSILCNMVVGTRQGTVVYSYINGEVDVLVVYWRHYTERKQGLETQRSISYGAMCELR